MTNYNFISFKNIYISSVTLMLVFLLAGCDDLVEIDPPKTEVLDTDVFKTDASANAALTGMYSSMIAGQNMLEVGFGASLSADETDPLYIFNFAYFNFGTNNMIPADYGALGYWSNFYSLIYQTNSIIGNSTKSTGMTAAGKLKVIAEAKFVRAMSYFYLVNMFGPVPLVVTSDVNINKDLPRASTTEVYAQIVSDLKDSEANLPSDYSSYGGKRDKPNKSAATALLSKVYLYTKDYVNAEKTATDVISAANLYTLLPKQDIANVFLKDSQETIFALNTATATGHFITYENNYYMFGYLYGIYGPSYVMTSSLANAFEAGDIRKTAWASSFDYNGTTYFYGAKYKDYDGVSAPLEYSVVLRLAEVYLIRAEARANQNKIAGASGAVADVNAVHTRAGLIALDESLNQPQCLTAIEKERRVELFLEYGNRWFDLKRIGRVDAVIGGLKPDSWQSTDALYPIPLEEIKKAPQLKQNDGY